MRLDGADVVVNDRVWHDRYGYGMVERVDNGTCDVRFGGASDVVTFTNGGMQGNYKVLFWQEPMIFIPEKGRDYSGLREMVSALMTFKYGGGA